MKDSVPSKGVIRSAQTVLFVLKAFSNLPLEVSLSEVTEATGLPKMKSFRALTTLVSTDFLVQNATTRKYRLHHSILDLSSIVLNQQGQRDLVHDQLLALANEIGEDVTFAIPTPDYSEIVFIDRLKGGARISFFCDVGKHLPLHVGAAGKAILAFLPEAKFEDYLSRFKPVKVSPFTLVGKEDLRVQRQEILHRGYSISNQEVDEGVSAVGVCFLNTSGMPVAAAAIASLSMKMTESRIEVLGNRLKEAVSSISGQTGFYKDSHAFIKR
jgi:DNA-binding IclR family transcriptional regulator